MIFTIETPSELRWLSALWPGAQLHIGMSVNTHNFIESSSRPDMLVPIRLRALRRYDFNTDTDRWIDSAGYVSASSTISGSRAVMGYFDDMPPPMPLPPLSPPSNYGAQIAAQDIDRNAFSWSQQVAASLNPQALQRTQNALRTAEYQAWHGSTEFLLSMEALLNSSRRRAISLPPREKHRATVTPLPLP